MFTLDKTMPNGALARFHRAVKYEVHDDGTHAIVNSYHSEEMNLISWQDTYVIPPSIVVQTLADVEFLLTYANAPFAGGVIIPDEASSLHTMKARKRAEVKIKRDNVEWQGVTTPLGIIDSDPDAQRKVTAKMVEALAFPEAFTAQWRMKDNSIVVHDAAAMLAMGEALTQHVSACQAHKDELDLKINMAATPEDLAAIDIEEGWPVS